MADWTAKDPDWERRVRASFDRRKMMPTIGATIAKLTPRCSRRS